MHSWEVMQQPIHYDHHHNWYGGIQVKRESPDIAAYAGGNTLGQESHISSPASVQSEESTHHQQNIFDSHPMHMTQMRPPGFNPLTPPGYPSAIIPPTSKPQPIPQHNESPPRSFIPAEPYPLFNNLTPTNSPPMNVTPPKSPKDTKLENDDNTDTNCEMDDETLSNCDIEDDPNGKPQINSHGKQKTFRCKQCDFTAITKIDFWEHSRLHIKPERLLTCHLCSFVTEYKHHLEYHLHKHLGSKPFKCEECDYSCVNKSMLNSHKKSHSNIYQYRCASCKYATKYCHSLKLHLRKYRHQPAMVLNADGTPNPLPIIDVYGTRRGPKTKKSTKSSPKKTPPTNSPSTQQNNQQQTTNHLTTAMASRLLPNFANILQTPLFPYFQLAAMQQLSQLPPSPRNNDDHMEDIKPSQPELNLLASTALDLTQQSLRGESSERELTIDEDKKSHSSPASSTSSTSQSCKSSRRKGRAVRLDLSKMTPNHDQDSSLDTMDGQEEKDEEMHPPASPIEDQKTSQVYECKFCEITFKDTVLYSIHMGYHGYNDVFKCNMCGEKSTNKVDFFLHIARKPHC